MDVHYKTKSFYLVTSLPIHLKCKMTYCADYHFNETIFLPLGGEEPIIEERHEIIWNALTLTNFDPRTNQCELEVQKDYSFARTRKSTAKCFVWCKESDKIIFTDLEYSSTNWCP